MLIIYLFTCFIFFFVFQTADMGSMSVIVIYQISMSHKIPKAQGGADQIRMTPYSLPCHITALAGTEKRKQEAVHSCLLFSQ